MHNIARVVLYINYFIIYIRPCNARAGDILVLTKPLGTQLATNAFIWMTERNEKYEQLKKHFTDEDIEETYQMALKSMMFLNKTGISLRSSA